MSDRSFTIVDARGTDGCATKFSVKGHGGRYKGTHARAAVKAFNILCKVKKIKGQCAMIITVRETTQGSDSKELTYKCRREKLDKPLVLPNGVTVEYKSVAHAHKGPMPPCKAGLGKTSGPMKAKKGKKGTMKTGTMKTGTMKTGTMKTGTMKTGTMKTGTMNTGTMNTGTMKTGTMKTGTMNTGTMKTGMDMSKAKKTKKVKAPSGFLNKIKKMI